MMPEEGEIMSISAQLEIVGKLHLEFMSGQAANSGSVLTYVLQRARDRDGEGAGHDDAGFMHPRNGIMLISALFAEIDMIWVYILLLQFVSWQVLS